MESGHTPSRRHPEYWGGSIPWIGIKDAKVNHGRRIDDTEQKTNELGLANSSARLLPENTVCLSRTASVGYVVVMGRPMATSQDFVNWVCSEELTAEFLKYLFIAEGKGILRFASGAVHQTIYFPEAKAFHICHPDVSEQRRIVGILDEAFAGIATAKANAEKNLQNASALFESHLNAVFTQRGDGWEEKRVPDVCLTFGRGKSRHRPRSEPSLYGGVYPFIQTGDLNNADHVVTKYTQTYNEKGLAQSKLWPKGTVGIAIVGATIGETAVLGFEGCFPDSVIGMTTDPLKADPYFLEYMLQHFKEVVKSQGEGSARHNINLATFDKLRFPMPPVTEQQRIVGTTDALKSQIRKLESTYQCKLAALDELKKSLLHEAFSGKLTGRRVSPELAK
jgi:type I restriction enzyme S subunit